jgi:hypothetical protein
MIIMTTPRPCLPGLVAAVLLLTGTALASWPPGPAGPTLRVHPDLPETLDGAWLERLALFPEIEDLVRVRFERATWGATLVRLEIEDPERGLRVVLRNVTDTGWRQLQERAEAVVAGREVPREPISGLGEVGALTVRPPEPPDVPDPAPDAPDDPDVPDFLDDPLAAIRAWPEAPPPPAALPRELLLETGPVPVRGSWLAIIEVGGRLDVTSFNAFFSPMAQIGIAFGRGLTNRLIPLLGFHAGFGDMRGDFESAFGEGRTNAFGFTLSSLLRQPLGERQSLYVEGGGGYLIRSLYWGGVFVDPFTGQLVRGRVIEQQDWGYTLRVGWMRSRDHANRPRLLDIGFGVMTSPAEQWVFRTEDQVFSAGGRDTWLVLTVRFWDGL